MYVLLEISYIPRTFEVQKVVSWGPFATRADAITYFCGLSTSVIRGMIEADEHQCMTINNSTIVVTELYHPHEDLEQ